MLLILTSRIGAVLFNFHEGYQFDTPEEHEAAAILSRYFVRGDFDVIIAVALCLSFKIEEDHNLWNNGKFSIHGHVAFQSLFRSHLRLFCSSGYCEIIKIGLAEFNQAERATLKLLKYSISYSDDELGQARSTPRMALNAVVGRFLFSSANIYI